MKKAIAIFFIICGTGILGLWVMSSAGIWGHRGEWGLFGMIILGTVGIEYFVINKLKKKEDA